MICRHVITAALFFVTSITAQGTGTVNTATITDATKVPETPASVPTLTSSDVTKSPLQTTVTDPGAATAPGAAISVTAGASVTATDISESVVKPTVVAAVAATDLFAQIASDDPATVLKGSVAHSVTPEGVSSDYQGTQGLPIATNNYYGNLLVGDQDQPAYAMPYSVFWQKGSGLCAWNALNTQYYYGSYSDESTTGPHYYYNAPRLCPIGFSSTEMSSSQTMTASNIDHQSVHLTFSPGSASGTMVIPLVQGSAFLTSIYTGLTPQLFGGAFTSLTGVTFKSAGSIAATGSKYRATINNGDTWLIYVFPTSSSASSTMTLTSTSALTGPAGFSGIIQIAKLPANYVTTDEAVYDFSAGTYATQNVISGTSTGAVGHYSFDFGAQSVTGSPLLSFLFSHQISSITTGDATTLKLWSNTKGQMQAFTGDILTFSESDMPIDVQFLPWSPVGAVQSYSVDALKAIATAANAEAAQVMSLQTNLDSMYYSGKALAKFAQICLTINDVLGKDASSCVSELEQSIATFISNSNINPIVYDTVWKGAISSCGNSGCDFGNAWYNDHHFHYGYFVYTAAVIGHLDPAWLTTSNKAYINTLIRDFANPSTSDTAFPQFRAFDWYAGHSWAHGITAAGDGKDEESSSEDYNAIYGMKLWGKVTGDASMEGRGNLMLAVMRRSMQSYMLMSSDNAVQPAAFVPQFVAGITFMNKVDHTTYFGRNEEYIQGIHMLPLTPISAYIRSPTFVAEEWSAVIQPIISGVSSGWLGILMANYAIANSTASYDFFSSSTFSSNYLDGGASLTWYLTYAAGLGGSPDSSISSSSSSISLVPTSTSVSSKLTSVSSVSTSTSILPTPNVVSQSSTFSVSSSRSTSISGSATLIGRTSAGAPSVTGSAINVPITKGAITSSISASASQTSTPIQTLPVSDSTSVSTSSAVPTRPIDTTPSTVVTLSLGRLSVSCSAEYLVVGDKAGLITIYDNGTLACDGHNAMLLPRSTSQSAFSIELSAIPSAKALKSKFLLKNNTLLLYLASLFSKKRQDDTLTAGDQQLTFAYDQNNVVFAVLPGQNTTLTTFVPQISVVAVSSTTSTSTDASQTSSSDAQGSSTTLVPSQTTSVTSSVSIQTLTSASTTPISSQTTSVISTASNQSLTSAATLTESANGAAAQSAQITSSSAQGGNAVNGLANSQGSATTVTSATAYTSFTTITYSTTINGQATVVSTVVPIGAAATNVATTMSIINIVGAQKAGAAAGAIAGDADVQGTTITSTLTTVVQGTTLTTTFTSVATGFNTQTTGLPSVVPNVVIATVSSAGGNVAGQSYNATGSSNSSIAASNVNNLPIVKASTLPTYASASNKIVFSFGSIIAMLLLHLA